MTSPSRWGAGPLTLFGGDVPTLDLDASIGQVQSQFKFYLTDGPTRQPLGEIHPRMDNPPVIEHDTTRVIPRKLEPLELEHDETAEIDPVRHRVEPVMIVNGVEYPLGRYAFSDHTEMASRLGHHHLSVSTHVSARDGAWSSNVLLDEMFIVDTELEQAFSTQEYARSSLVIESADVAIRRLLIDFPIIEIIDEPTSFFSKGGWPAGSQRGTVMNDLALFGDYFAPWFGNDGRLHLIRAFDPALMPLDFDWDAQQVVLRNSIPLTSDLLTAPNRIIVVSNDPVDTSVAVFGSYDVPLSAPHSIFNRGYVVPKTFEMQVSTTEQAFAVAANIGQRRTLVERITTVTPPDPRHDSYNVVRWQGNNWLEIGWSMTLKAGGEMSHTLRRAYI